MLTAGLAGINVPSSLDFRPAVTRNKISYRMNGRTHVADIYQPIEPALAAIVLAHGAVETGKNDPRLQQLAALLAGARFNVLVPDIPNLRRLQLTAESSKDLVDAADYLLSRKDLTNGGGIGIGAFSVAVSLALLAANDPKISDDLQFVLAVGGYFDFNRLLSFMTTGYYQADGNEVKNQPSPGARWLIAMSNAGWLEDMNDRNVMTSLARRKLENADSDVDSLVAELSPAGGTVYALLNNSDPIRFTGLLEDLPSSVQAKISALNLAEQNLSQFSGHVILVHGMDDNVIPFPESQFLRDALPQGQASLHLLRGLQHVDIKTSMIDGVEMLRAVRSVVSQRQK